MSQSLNAATDNMNAATANPLQPTDSTDNAADNSVSSLPISDNLMQFMLDDDSDVAEMMRQIDFDWWSQPSATIPDTVADPPIDVEMISSSDDPSATIPDTVADPPIDVEMVSSDDDDVDMPPSSTNATQDLLEYALQNPYLDEMHAVIAQNFHYIETSQVSGPVIDTFNFQLFDRPVDSDLLTRSIYNTQTFAFKLNASVGSVLRNNETGEVKFYYQCFKNQPLFDETISIDNASDWAAFLEKLTGIDYADKATALQRENTNWTLLGVTNICFYVFKSINRLLGFAAENFPQYLVKNKGLHALIKNNNNGKPYEDNLCLFRCYALHQDIFIASLERAANKYLNQYDPKAKKATFQGISLQDLDNFEKIFQVNVTVFSLDKDDNAILIHRSVTTFPEIMYVNLFEAHFSYIIDLNKYSKCFICSKCDKQFNQSRCLCWHMRDCKGAKAKRHFPGGIYSPAPTLATLLEEHDLYNLPSHIRLHPYRAVFDIESYFPSTTTITPHPDRLSWTNHHIPLSVSVCSNVEGFEKPKCFVTNGSSQSLVDDMISYLEEIQQVSSKKLQEASKDIYKQIEEKLQFIENTDPEFEKHPLYQIKSKLYSYLQTIPVIGFSSGRYDLNVLSKFILRYFTDAETQPGEPATAETSKKLIKENKGKLAEPEEQEEEKSHNLILKRTNQYLLLSNNKFKFLDIQNYLPPGFSYRQYLAAYECSQTKSFFPYEHITSLETLNETTLPPIEAFFSSIHGQTITEQEYLQCQRTWEELKMTTLRDWLIHYNNLDTEPFIEALQKQSKFFLELNLDMFYDAISLPGLSDRLLHSTTDAFFNLFNDKNADIYDAFRQSVCGGPAIVFNRYHEKNKTQIRSVDPTLSPHEVCQTIEGFDANSLYLKCLGDPMPVGFFCKRTQENSFKLESPCRQSQSCLEWLDFVSKREGVEIKHIYNSGREKRLGGKQIPVDGWCPDTQTAYNFHGCYFHGHSCSLTTKMNEDTKKEKHDKTQKVDEYLQKICPNIVIMRECEWMSYKKSHATEVYSYISKPKPSRAWRTGSMTEEEIKLLILSGELFGMAEVDIHVPDHLKAHFSEFCPIFKNTEVSLEHIGDHMKAFATERNLLRQPCRSLISSFFANKCFFVTPLLQWYLQRGLIITKVYQVVQYHSQACFDQFVNKVTDARRSADTDSTQAILATGYKLLGNSAYGRTLMRVDRHKNYAIVDQNTAAKTVSNPFFRGLVALGDDLYETQTAKKSVVHKLPIQIGLFVYGYAKLRLLKFYYEFLDYYVDRRHYELITCDTDSLYIALSKPSLEQAIKPERKRHFQAHRDEWLPSVNCTQHKNQPELSDLPCCKATHRFQCRTPGLWKLEAKADSIISLAPKSYICINPQNTKVTCKGVQKKLNPLTFHNFASVLHTKQPHHVTNRGFRLDQDHDMRSYIQPKRGLTYLYIKRRVLDDGRSTIPLDL